MRDTKILLIYPPNQLMGIETPRPDGSLGPLYLAGALRQMGVEADVLDATVGSEQDSLEDTFYRPVLQENGLIRIGMAWERLTEFLATGNYDIVGIHSNFTPQTRMALEVARIARELNSRTLILAGGINARSLWQRFLVSGDFDLIITTEGEWVIQEIVRRFAGNQDYGGIPGTIRQHEGRIEVTPPREETFLTDLDLLPFPAWDKLPFAKYAQIDSPHGVDLTGSHQLYAPLMTSRGCPFQCAYCHISTERFDRNPMSGNIGNLRLKSIERVLEEIETLRNLGVRKIFIEDDSLLAKKARVQTIFRAIRSLGLTIADVNGVNLVHLFQKTSSGRLEPDREYLQLLAESGFRQIVFPVESGSQRILDTYATGKLRHDLMDVVELTRVASSVGIICPINMMIGFPDETEQEMMASVTLAQRLVAAGAPYVTFFLPIPFPGSRLYELAIERGHLQPDFDPDIMNWKNGVMQNTAVPLPRTVEIRDWAWETVNHPQHVRARLAQSIGSRWQS